MLIDPIDTKILTMLQEDSRMTIKEMASHLSISATPVYERIKKMERAGIIHRYGAVIDPIKLGLKLTAFIHVSLNAHSKEMVETFMSSVLSFDEVMECYHVSGRYDFLVKVLTHDMESYHSFILNKLSVVANLGKIESQFALSSRSSTVISPKM